MAQTHEVMRQEELLSQRNLPLIRAAATYWAHFIPEESRQIFFDTLVADMSAFFDKPEDPRRRNPAFPTFLPVTTYEFGIGGYDEPGDYRGIESDPRIWHALKVSGASPDLLPHHTHTVIDTESGNVMVRQIVKKDYQSATEERNIFPILPELT